MATTKPLDGTLDGSPEQIALLASKYSGRAPGPEMAAVLRSLMSFGNKPLSEISPSEARKQKTPADAVKKLLEERGLNSEPEDVGKVVNRSIDGPAGKIAIRIYTPSVAKVEGQCLPVVLYIHGGGWVIANLDVYDASARAMCNKAHAIVVSTHYRQAPEHKFPAAHDDTYAAYKWVLANAGSIDGDSKRVALVGESAGGNMAGVISLRARDDGLQMPLHQVLVYPIADNDMTSESYLEMENAIPLNAPGMKWFAKQYLEGTDGGMHPLMWLNQANLAGLPPTTIINAELDPLRTEGEILSDRMRAAGVPVTQRTYPGVTHEFFGMSAVLQKARDAQKLAGGALRAALGTGTGV
jgi:acetyl esterase